MTAPPPCMGFTSFLDVPRKKPARCQKGNQALGTFGRPLIAIAFFVGGGMNISYSTPSDSDMSPFIDACIFFTDEIIPLPIPNVRKDLLAKTPRSCRSSIPKSSSLSWMPGPSGRWSVYRVSQDAI